MMHAGTSGRSFASLEALQLGNNCIAAWEHICTLDAFPTLRELRVTGNPCLDGLSTVNARLEVSSAEQHHV